MRAGVTPALLSVEWLALEDHSLRQDMERRFGSDAVLQVQEGPNHIGASITVHSRKRLQRQGTVHRPGRG